MEFLSVLTRIWLNLRPEKQYHFPFECDAARLGVLSSIVAYSKIEVSQMHCHWNYTYLDKKPHAILEGHFCGPKCLISFIHLPSIYLPLDRALFQSQALGIECSVSENKGYHDNDWLENRSCEPKCERPINFGKSEGTRWSHLRLLLCSSHCMKFLFASICFQRISQISLQSELQMKNRREN